ncbi:hypothetical protein ACFQ07_29580 [Actinomadura adrarensis]|uniref:Uncharacterized protein n=1 Tax=Actinomadura adrarensis TaxID=1819600 RepID=A0ABW3CS19_9ACTN
MSALHDLLAGRPDEHTQRFNQLEKVELRQFTTMVNAAFFEGARQRFLKDGVPATDEEIIDYVAWARTWDDSTAQELDPDTGEQLIKVVVEKLPMTAMDDLDNNISYSSKLMLVATFVREAKYDEEGLAEFMARVRKTADMMLS